MKDLKKQFIKTFIIGAVLLTGIALLINMIFDNLNLGRFDLTADQVYKLSPSVEKILSKLDAPIEITYYVSSSEKMPTKWKNLERDVIDKLEELKLASKGKLTYSVFDPTVEEEREALEEQQQQESAESAQEATKPTVDKKKIAEQLNEKGVIPFGVQSTERDEFAIKRIYSSLVLSYLDRKEDVIEEVRPEMFGNLEYEIMSRIYKLISNERPKIGFYPSVPEIPPQYRRQFMGQEPPDMYTSPVKLLKDSGYDVMRTNIGPDDPIPEGIKTFVAMIDQPLNERQKFEIDRLIHKGVNVIMAFQYQNFQITPSRNDPGSFDVLAMPSQLNLNSFTRNYGFEVDEDVFMDRSTAYIQVPAFRTRSMGMFQIQEQRYEPVTKPVIIKVNAENINNEVSISNKITELFYLYGSRLKLIDERLEENTLKATMLFTSSSRSWTRETTGYRPIDTSEPPDEAMLKNQPLGVLIEGKFDPFYKDETVPPWSVQPGEELDNQVQADSADKIEGESEDAKLIVYGCANLFKNDVIENITSHKALLLNSVDALTLGDDLINIRSKNIVARRIKETGSVSKAFTKAFVVWFPPLVFIGLGIYLTLKRKSKNQ